LTENLQMKNHGKEVPEQKLLKTPLYLKSSSLPDSGRKRTYYENQIGKDKKTAHES